jgi:hypothetical protein
MCCAKNGEDEGNDLSSYIVKKEKTVFPIFSRGRLAASSDGCLHLAVPSCCEKGFKYILFIPFRGQGFYLFKRLLLDISHSIMLCIESIVSIVCLELFL